MCVLCGVCGMCVCCVCNVCGVCVCVPMHMSIIAHGVQKRVPSLLESQLQAVVNCTMWVLGPEPESSGRVAEPSVSFYSFLL